MSEVSPDRARRAMAASATTALAGIALSASGNAAVGGWVVAAALLGLIASLHVFGRSGPDATLRAAPGRRRRG